MTPQILSDSSIIFPPGEDLDSLPVSNDHHNTGLGAWCHVVPESAVSKSLSSLAKLEKAQGNTEMSEKCAEIRERPQLKCDEKRC